MPSGAKFLDGWDARAADTWGELRWMDGARAEVILPLDLAGRRAGHDFGPGANAAAQSAGQGEHRSVDQRSARRHVHARCRAAVTSTFTIAEGTGVWKRGFNRLVFEKAGEGGQPAAAGRGLPDRDQVTGRPRCEQRVPISFQRDRRRMASAAASRTCGSGSVSRRSIAGRAAGSPMRPRASTTACRTCFVGSFSRAMSGRTAVLSPWTPSPEAAACRTRRSGSPAGGAAPARSAVSDAPSGTRRRWREWRTPSNRVVPPGLAWPADRVPHCAALRPPRARCGTTDWRFRRYAR